MNLIFDTYSDICINVLGFLNKSQLKELGTINNFTNDIVQYELLNRKTAWEKVFKDFKQLNHLLKIDFNRFQLSSIKTLINYSTGLVIVLLQNNLQSNRTTLFLTHFFDTQAALMLKCNIPSPKNVQVIQIPYYLSASEKDERFLSIKNDSEKHFFINYSTLNNIYHIQPTLPLNARMRPDWTQFSKEFNFQNTCPKFNQEHKCKNVFRVLRFISEKEIYLINFSPEQSLFVVYLFVDYKQTTRTQIPWDFKFKNARIRTFINNTHHIMICRYNQSFYLFDLRLLNIVVSYKCDQFFSIKPKSYLIHMKSIPLILDFDTNGITMFLNSNYTFFQFGRGYLFSFDENENHVLYNHIQNNSTKRITLQSLTDLPFKKHYLFNQIKDQLTIYKY